MRVFWTTEPSATRMRRYAPQRVLSTYAQLGRVGEWGSCPAVTGVLGNVFAWYAGEDARIRVGVMDDVEVEGATWRTRDRVKGQGHVNVQIAEGGLLVFAERIGVEGLWTAPYFSHTQHLQYGAMVPGAFDIGAWFRPLQWEFQLWPGVHTMEVREGEPLSYLQVLCSERVDVVPFRWTPRIGQIAAWCVQHKEDHPRVSMGARYGEFDATWRRALLEEIEANVEEA